MDAMDLHSTARTAHLAQHSAHSTARTAWQNAAAQREVRGAPAAKHGRAASRFMARAAKLEQPVAGREGRCVAWRVSRARMGGMRCYGLRRDQNRWKTPERGGPSLNHPPRQLLPGPSLASQKERDSKKQRNKRAAPHTVPAPPPSSPRWEGESEREEEAKESEIQRLAPTAPAPPPSSPRWEGESEREEEAKESEIQRLAPTAPAPPPPSPGHRPA